MIPQHLSGARVVVIGGASGIGAAVAKLARQHEAQVTICGHDEAQVRAAASAMGCRPSVMDIARRDSVQAAFEPLGAIDHLAITAGRRIVGKVADEDADRLLAVVHERIGGALYAIRAALPLLSEAASITLTSGVLADRPTSTGTAVLAAAVAGVEALARGLALELAPRRVNVVSPGVTATGLLNAMAEDAKRAFWADAASRIPLRRVATPEEIASSFIHLMTNPYVTGETLHVDGGARLA